MRLRATFWERNMSEPPISIIKNTPSINLNKILRPSRKFSAAYQTLLNSECWLQWISTRVGYLVQPRWCCTGRVLTEDGTMLKLKSDCLLCNCPGFFGEMVKLLIAKYSLFLNLGGQFLRSRVLEYATTIREDSATLDQRDSFVFCTKLCITRSEKQEDCSISVILVKTGCDVWITKSWRLRMAWTLQYMALTIVVVKILLHTTKVSGRTFYKETF